MAALLKWIQTPEADKIAKVAEKRLGRLLLQNTRMLKNLSLFHRPISPKTTQQPQKFISKQGQDIW